MDTPPLPLAGALPALPPGLRGLVAEFAHTALDEQAVPARILVLCRARIAALHTMPPADGDLPNPSTGALTAAERACLALAEKLPWAWHDISDDEVAAARAALGSDAALVHLIVSLALFDADCRVRLVLGADDAPPAGGG
jgi:alkylhydroperoxidase family enzyme